MGRFFLYTVLAALTVFVLAAAFVLDSGGGALESARDVTVHDLSVEPELHDGERVTTEGVLRRLTEPEEHFLVTADGLGVVVRGFAKGKLRRLADETVRVTGRFGFDAAGGTYIEADGVAPVQ